MNSSSPSVDPLDTSIGLMRVTGILTMVICAVTIAPLALIAIATQFVELLVALVVIFVPIFVLGFLVQTSANALRGRYTWGACVRAAIFALPLGPLGLIAGIVTLLKLYEAPVRASFNS